MEEDRRIYRCAIIGQNPMRFPWGFDEEDDRCQKLKMELAQQIMALRQRGVTQFLTACDCGVGLYAAEIVNGLRETTDQDLMLFCYTPHEEQATKWAPYLRERYFTMLEKCTHISVVCPVGTPDAQLQSYKKILGLADVVIYVHDADALYHQSPVVHAGSGVLRSGVRLLSMRSHYVVHLLSGGHDLG